MFINCPHCRFLVALDKDNQPLPRCPNCAARLRNDLPAGGDEKPVAEAAPQSPGSDPANLQQAGQTKTVDTGDESLEPALRLDSDAEVDTDVVDDVLEAEPPATESRPGTSLVAIDVSTGGAPSDAPIAKGAAATASTAPVKLIVVNSVGTAIEIDPVPGSDTPAPMVSVTYQAPARSWDDNYDPREPIALVRTPQLANPTQPASDRGEPAPTGRSDDASRTDTTAELSAPTDAAESTTHATAATVDPIALAAQIQRSMRPEPALPEVPAPREATPPPAQASDSSIPDPTVATGTAVEATQGVEAPPSGIGVATELAITADTAAQDDETAPRAGQHVVGTAAKQAAATPSFARRRAAAQTGTRRGLALRIAAIAALALTLLLQLLLADRDRLAGDARWRPLLGSLCGVLRCNLPAWREPHAMVVVERDVRAHPTLPGVLRVSARVRNDARWAQPWPMLQLTLSDIDGGNVATRYFTAREYLGGAPTQSNLGSGQSAAVSMDIVEPGAQAVAFTFDFL